MNKDPKITQIEILELYIGHPFLNLCVSKDDKLILTNSQECPKKFPKVYQTIVNLKTGE